jgi:hypothetical protein
MTHSGELNVLGAKWVVHSQYPMRDAASICDGTDICRGERNAVVKSCQFSAIFRPEAARERLRPVKRTDGAARLGDFRKDPWEILCGKCATRPSWPTAHPIQMQHYQLGDG